MRLDADVLRAAGAQSFDKEVDGQSGEDRAARAEAARKFEGLLIHELLKVMRKSAPMFESGRGQLYMKMFDSKMSEHLSEAGGIGLAPLIERALGGEDPALSPPAALAGGEGAGGDVGDGMAVALASRKAVQRYATPQLSRVAEPVRLKGAPAPGHTARLQSVAADMVGAGPHRWAKVGTLRPADLGSDFHTGDAYFNVRDAAGFVGHPKCNLFAFEVARRAGFQVPLVARSAGWGFPTADAVTGDAAAGRLPREWGKVVTGVSTEELARTSAHGERAFMLTGSGRGERVGHMAIVERVHQVDYDQQGRVQRVVFDGWEARTRGAQYLARRTWNRAGNPGGHDARSGFGRIEIIELKPAQGGASPELPLSDGAPPSIRDVLPSSHPANRPIPREEDAS